MKTPSATPQLERSSWSTGGAGRVKAESMSGAKFAAAVADVREQGGAEVRRGDNLTHMVKARAQSQGMRLDESTAYRLALQVAKQNHISNPDQITPGQRVDLAAVDMHLVARADAAFVASRTQAPSWLQQKSVAMPGDSSAPTQPVLAGEVLNRTLQRAVDKGFIPAGGQTAVRQKIETLSAKYGFSPDDFALVSLMESDGLNPQASNGSCHGVIQFCEGDNRGAASVGLADNPKSILGMGVLRQLDLVDQYLADAGVQAGAGLDDLYLAVLTPAARTELHPHAPLPIAGRQAAALYVNQDPSTYITRTSLTQGLLRHAASLLGLSVDGLVAMRQEAGSRVLAAKD